jgi:hypothetical protein
MAFFAPLNKLRGVITPGKYRKTQLEKQDKQSPVKRRVSMTWTQRLKRVFNIDIEICDQCGGKFKVIACIEDPLIIHKILTHLDNHSKSENIIPSVMPEPRAPPQIDLLN